MIIEIKALFLKEYFKHVFVHHRLNWFLELLAVGYWENRSKLEKTRE